MEYLNAEEPYNNKSEDIQGGDSYFGGAAKRLFTSQGEEFSAEDDEEFNDRVNTYERQQFLAGFITPNKSRDTNVNMNTRFLITRGKRSRDVLTSSKRIKNIQ